MEIKFFKNLPESELRRIAELHFAQWSPMNKSLNLANKSHEFTHEYAQHDDRLPMGMAAYIDGELAGFLRIKKTNLKKHPELTPWIANLLVLPKFRGRAVAVALGKRAFNTLKSMGYEKAYFYSDVVNEKYKRIGFQLVGKVDKNDAGQADLFVKHLN